MSTLALATICAGLIWLGLIAYAVLGGADFGGGIWDLLATGRLAARQRQAIADAIGPVWEANNVWLVYVIVVTWTAFPAVYATVSTALFVPVVLALVGIICRGAAFGFRSHYGRRAGIAGVWGPVFSVASTITPFLLGMVAGTLTDGAIHVVGGVVSVSYLTVWISPFSLACGAFAIGLCAVLAATYLTVEAKEHRDQALMEAFLVRAIVAGAVTAALGAIAAALAARAAPMLWRGLIGSALPFSLAAVLIGLATAASLWLGYYRAARLLVAAETACIFGAWGVAQFPYLVVPSLTLSNAASPASVLVGVTIASAAGMVVLLPSLWYLFHIFKGPGATQPKVTAAQLADDGLARVRGGPTSSTEDAEDTEGRREGQVETQHGGQERRALATMGLAGESMAARPRPALVARREPARVARSISPVRLSRARVLEVAAVVVVVVGMAYAGWRIAHRPRPAPGSPT